MGQAVNFNVPFFFPREGNLLQNTSWKCCTQMFNCMLQKTKCLAASKTNILTSLNSMHSAASPGLMVPSRWRHKTKQKTQYWRNLLVTSTFEKRHQRQLCVTVNSFRPNDTSFKLSHHGRISTSSFWHILSQWRHCGSEFDTLLHADTQ